ncbi:hypothetical protein [Dyadobacter alkalitolerans]|uniref:hypothetical protein n=1 Tax=Dyadobacter alkalitolerans TaxID=492736 RepID=UPI000557C46F|nr:hypothetical protein [Dyadobacter alkalitolerans]
MTYKLAMTYKIVCPVKNNQVILTLPPNFRDKTEVTVYVDDQIDAKSKKLEAMKMAAKDPMFLADISEIHTGYSDHNSQPWRENLPKRSVNLCK